MQFNLGDIESSDIFGYNFLVVIIITIVLKINLNNNICLKTDEKLCDKPEQKMQDNQINYTCSNSKKHKETKLSPLYKSLNWLIYIGLLLVILINITIFKDAKRFAEMNLLKLIVYNIPIILLILQFTFWSLVSVFCNNSNYKCDLNFDIMENTTMPGYKFVNVSCSNNVSNFSKGVAALVNNFNSFNLFIIMMLVLAGVFYLILFFLHIV